MGFSEEWDRIYRAGQQLSVWPWSNVVSYVSRLIKRTKIERVLELGCGAGANIPFFLSKGIDYYAMEGSEYEVKSLKERFPELSDHILCGDFTRSIPFETSFDLILDRAAISHNSLVDIQKTIEMASKLLRTGGIFLSLDWQSVRGKIFADNKYEYSEVDAHTRIYTSGDFENMGKIHFFDFEEIQDLFAGYRLTEALEKSEQSYISSDSGNIVQWEIVAEKTDGK